jgi:hypothetical protein
MFDRPSMKAQRVRTFQDNCFRTVISESDNRADKHDAEMRGFSVYGLPEIVDRHCNYMWHKCHQNCGRNYMAFIADAKGYELVMHWKMEKISRRKFFVK